MFKASHYITDLKQIPSKWIFEKYLNLESLEGQSLNIKSIYNTTEKSPSLFIYYSDTAKDYRFKCFSSGKFGDGYNFMAQVWGLSLNDTIKKIIDDYIKDSPIITPLDFESVTQHKARLVKYQIKNQWSLSDLKYWAKFNINKHLLREYFIFPIEYYVIEKNNNTYMINHENMYGYFTKEGKLYKIYQPLIREFKFFTISHQYIQGADQCMKKDTLIICSSLKDILSLKSLGVNADMIAPNSENTIFTKYEINVFKKKYKRIITIFDSDSAGVKASKTYLTLYDIPFVYIGKAKDISDLIRETGVSYATYLLIPKIHNALEKYISLQNEKVEIQKKSN